jgi:hypothetical protein
MSRIPKPANTRVTRSNAAAEEPDNSQSSSSSAAALTSPPPAAMMAVVRNLVRGQDLSDSGAIISDDDNDENQDDSSSSSSSSSVAQTQSVTPNTVIHKTKKQSKVVEPNADILAMFAAQMQQALQIQQERYEHQMRIQQQRYVERDDMMQNWMQQMMVRTKIESESVKAEVKQQPHSTPIKKVAPLSPSNKNIPALQQDLYDDEESDEEEDVNEKEIYEDEVNETEFESYVLWLSKREEIYPYEKCKNMYKQRYSLLSPAGRHYEYMRTLFYTKCNNKLFPSQAQRWFKYIVQKWLGINIGKVRTVDERSITMPQMSYDVNDQRMRVNKYGDCDLSPACATLSFLPAELNDHPSDELNVGTSPISIEAFGTQHFKNRIILRSQINEKVEKDIPSNSESIIDESFDCKICGVNVTDNPYSKHCKSCDSTIRKSLNKYTSRGTIPKLEVDPSLFVSYNSGAAVDLAVQQRRIKQETQAHQHRIEIETDDEEKKCVLGAALTLLFGPTAILRMRLSRGNAVYSERDLMKAVSESAIQLKTFSGDRNKAPRWLSDYCAQVYRYMFQQHHCIDLLSRCFVSEAKTWLETNLYLVAVVDRPIEALVIKFKDHFMGHAQQVKWRTFLQTTKLTGYTATLSDLKKHYEVFVNTANSLMLCEPTLDEASVRNMFVESLPSGVRQFMGMAHESCKSLDAIMQIAEAATMSANANNQSTSHGKLPRMTTVNANAIQIRGVNYVPVNKITTSAEQNKKTTTCFHCGLGGHFTGECTLINDEQTLKGKTVWATRNRDKGYDFPYDKQYYIALQQHMNDGGNRASFYYNNNNNNNNRSVSQNVPANRNSNNSKGRGGRHRGRGGNSSSRSSSSSSEATPGSVDDPEVVDSE